MEYSKIEEVNKRLTPVTLEKKSKDGRVHKNDYNTVNQRILAFREICPDGTITTEILSLADGVVTMKATITDGTGKIIATGHAQEKEESSFINKTSFIENCETSCVGRALGFIGIGATTSLASFEEVANAIKQQEQNEVEDGMKTELKELYDKAGGKDFEKWVKNCGGISAETYPVMKAKLYKQITEKAEAEGKNE